ncbi:MAG: PDDEXK nuclease domain-containing protein [Rhodoferax sp.]|uniref:PDDEXK nuclease domain-containing protein n=1 Tax=Rhodoferax sp. TaxID=50421 RepID=UPI0026397386|nr:PDDEXK nuclease domain-containing protein [Rhodoferax sp.]MDD2880010.1 PDDEXK nuclease domain-containing protein [Rhodoferax sp.]
MDEKRPRKIVKAGLSPGEFDLNFSSLVGRIQQVHEELTVQASRAVNASLTLRNWMIGLYVEAYERRGVDRAEYGDKLMDRLSDSLTRLGISRCDRREIYRYRQFYLTYPQIVEAAAPQWLSFGLQGVGLEGQAVGDAAPLSTVEPTPSFRIDGKTLVSRLSFTHIVELINLQDVDKRTFFEVECIQGNWSVRELKRQIHSLYYERCGLSIDKKKLSGLVQLSAQKASLAMTVRDPYVFEFLGLTPQEVMNESHLEGQLIGKIEDFLLELGHGFCFEARQKRILIGDEYYFVDLVFYHRILKCHVLVELKLAEFSHENIGQLNTYVSWYKQEMMSEGDNPPIGILLCTHKKHSLAKFALAGMDNQLFVSKYQLELPKSEDIVRFLEQKLQEACVDQADSPKGAGGSECK